MRVLVTGATGFVGGRLARSLREDGVEVRCLVRDRRKDVAVELEGVGCEVHEGDVTDAKSLDGAFGGIDLAYYLIHGMGRGQSNDFLTREEESARNFARAATAQATERVAYLGGLGGEHAQSQHLRSRQRTGEILREEGPPLTWLRASMVVGEGSESFETIRHLVHRLPVMIAPAWLRRRGQPIADSDMIEILRQVPRVEASAGREVEVGGPDVLRYTDMIDLMAEVMGRRHPPKIPVPLLTPRLSSLWIGLVTPMDAGVARPLVESLQYDTVVEDPSGMSLFDLEPLGMREAFRRALEC